MVNTKFAPKEYEQWPLNCPNSICAICGCNYNLTGIYIALGRGGFRHIVLVMFNDLYFQYSRV